MGKRSRKRLGDLRPAPRPAAGSVGGVPVHARTLDRRARRDEAPKAPWAPFPLVELCVLLGMVLILGGFLFGGDHAGLLLALGFSLVSVAGIELAVREHLAGLRSLSVLLAGCVAVVLVLPLFFLTRLPQEVLLIVGFVLFVAATQGLRGLFARKTGGLGFRA